MDRLLSCTPREQAYVDEVATALDISALRISLPECSKISIDDDDKITVSSLSLWGIFEIVEIEGDGDVYVTRDCGPNSFCHSEKRTSSGSVSMEKLKAAQALIRSKNPIKKPIDKPIDKPIEEPNKEQRSDLMS